MAAGNGMNMAVGLDLSQLQKDLKVLDRDLNSVTGQEKVVKIRPIIETTKINQATGEVEKCAREGFEPLYKSIKRLEEAQKGLRFSVNGNLFNVSTMKEAQRALTQLRKEFNALEKNGGMTVDLRRQYTNGISALAEWQKATKDATKKLGQFGFIDYDKEAGKIKALRREYNREMKAIRAEMSGLSDTAPRDLARREQLLSRLITLQEKYNSTYKSASSQKRQIVTDLRAERDAIRLKQAEATILARINSLENDRANAKNLTKKISQIQTERSAVGKLISSYEQLAARQRKLGANSAAAEQRVAMLKQEHIALKNLEAEERARQKAVNQNNALLNDQEKIWGKLWTFASRYLNIFMLWNFGKKIIETTGYFQQQQVALEGILGSAAKAEKAILRIKNMALNSPKTTYELVGYTKQLAAYDVGNGDPDKLLNTVHELAELSTGLGVDMQRLILAYGQVNAASVLRGQELRQFTEAGIPLVEKLAEKFTELNGKLVTTGEVFGLISKRQVSFEMVASVLSDMTKEGGKFYEMQSRITDTLYGQMQKLNDLWTINLDRLGKSTGGLLMNIVKGLQSLVRNMRPIANALLTFAMLKTVVKWFNTLVLLSGTLHVRMLRSLVTMRALTRELRAARGLMASLNVLAKMFTSSGWGLVLNIALSAIAGIVGLIVKARQKTKEWNRTLDEINTSFAKDTIALTSGIDKLIGKLRTLNSTSKEYKDTMETLRTNYGEYISDSILTQLENEMTQVDKTALSWGRLSDAIKQAIFDRKEYERHESRRTTSIDNIIKDLEGDFNKVVKNVIKEHTTRESYLENSPGGVKTRRYYDRVDAIGAELKRKNANGAILAAVREALEMGLGEDGLQPLLEEQLLRYGFTPGAAGALGDKSKEIFKKVKKAQGYKEYTEESEYIDSALQTMIDRRFREAAENINNNYANYTGKKDGRGSYNPFGIHEYSNNQYIGALRDILTSDQYSRYVPKDFTKGLMQNQQFLSAINMKDIDEGKTKAIADAITAFAKDLGDPRVAKNISTIVDSFIKVAGTNGIDAARVRTHMAQYVHFGGMNLTDDEKDYINRWKPTDQNIKSNISAISAEYQQMHDENDKMLSHDKDATFNEDFQKNERLMKILDVLAMPEYYNQGSWLKQSGGRTEREFPEWVNIFKDAYELYKKAITEGGTEAGVAKVRTDKTVQELYGDFFGKPGAVKEFSFNIGNKSIADIIQDNLIKGGLEDGIVDFRAAATAAAKEMISYGNASKETRGHFIRAGEQLLKWVSDTFADDSVAKWLKELSTATENLTVSFENMHNNIELGRKMTEIGTTGSFATIAGVNMPNLTKPRSVEQRENIGKLLASYNDWAGKATDENGKPIAKPFSLTKDISNMNLAEIAEELRKLTDESDMNMQALRATKEGNIMMNKLTAALKELDKTVREEAARVSGKAGTGNRLSDAVHNAKINADREMLDNETIQKIAAALKMSPDQVAASIRVDTAKSSADDILKAFLESNDYDTMFKAFHKPIDFSKIEGKLNELIAGLPEIERMEVQKRYNVMRGEADVFNASRGDFAPFFAGLNNYRTADQRAYDVWSSYANDTKATQLGSRFNENTNAWSLEGITDPEALAYLNELNRSLDEVGKKGIKLSAVFKQQALDSVKKFASTAQNTLNSMSDVVKNLVSSVQAFVKAFNKAYDVMNDGENPKWMQDTEAFLGDFAENFEMLIAPMTAVIALIIGITVAITVCEAVATPLLIVMAAVVAAAAILAAIIAAFQQHDRNLEHSIDDLKADVEAFDNAITNLQAAAERSVGFDKLRKNIAATGKELEKATAYAEMARLEKDKKNTDDDKVKEYEQSAQESLDAFLNNLRDVRDELATATEEWADQMGSAIRSAFQNGENAARAFRNTVKTMIGDVIENMLEMAILQPLIESALENWTNSDYLRQKYTKEWTEKDDNGNVIKRSSFDQDNYLKELLENIGDPDKAENFYQSMLMIGDTLIDTVNGMPSVLQDFYKYNSELGTLSGGIESVTEDTARRIEALDNSQLGELFAIRTLLEQYLGSTGGFGDSTMASVQAAVVSIASDTSLIRIATDAILNQLNELRTGPSRPIHVTMV